MLITYGYFLVFNNEADPTNAGWSGDVLDNIGLQPDTEMVDVQQPDQSIGNTTVVPPFGSMDWDAGNGNSNSQPTPQPSTLDDPEHEEQQVGDEEEQ